MTALVFHTRQGVAEIQFKSTANIRISGGAISVGGPVLARHVDGAWHVGTQRIERIICKGGVRVEFDGKAGRRALGPFEELSLADDVATSVQGIVARYQPFEQTWYFDHGDAERDTPLVAPLPSFAPA